MSHPKRVKGEELDSVSSAPESGQPPGGREPPPNDEPLATEEPRIASPEEDADRATRRMEEEANIEDADDAWDVAAADNPLRIPGESSPMPSERREEERRSAGAPRPRGR